MHQELANKLQAMTLPELYDAVYCDPLTGLLNRRALVEDDRKFIAIIDADSLKYVNDTLGYRWGDHHLCGLAIALADQFGAGSCYRISGDEFAVKTDQPVRVYRDLLMTRKDYPGFSFGIGSDLVNANAALKKEKANREVSGQRAPRGERPVWFDRYEGVRENG